MTSKVCAKHKLYEKVMRFFINSILKKSTIDLSSGPTSENVRKTLVQLQKSGDQLRKPSKVFGKLLEIFGSTLEVFGQPRGGGGGLPYKGLLGTCSQPGYVFRDFCLKQGIKFIIFCLNQGIDLSIFVLNKISLLGR